MPPADTELDDPVVRRANGCECPWSPYKWLTLALFWLMCGVHFGFLRRFLPGPLVQLCVDSALACVLLGFFVLYVLVLRTNPADPAVLRTMPGSGSSGRICPSDAELGRSRAAPAADSETTRFCDYCTTFVSESSKHCRRCNKCVAGFDHHCPALQQCIGERNYRQYFAMLSLGVLQLLVYMSVSVYTLVFSFTDEAMFRSTYPVVDLNMARVLLLLYTILIVAVCIALGHLFSFHVFLIWHGITTYQYFWFKREASDQNLELSKIIPKKNNFATLLPVRAMRFAKKPSAESISKSSKLSMNSIKPEDATPARDASELLEAAKELAVLIDSRQAMPGPVAATQQADVAMSASPMEDAAGVSDPAEMLMAREAGLSLAESPAEKLVAREETPMRPPHLRASRSRPSLHDDIPDAAQHSMLRRAMSKSSQISEASVCATSEVAEPSLVPMWRHQQLQPLGPAASADARTRADDASSVAGGPFSRSPSVEPAVPAGHRPRLPPIPA